MGKSSLLLALAAAVAVAAGPADAVPFDAPNAKALITPAMVEEFRAMLQTPVIVMSIKAQNERRKGLTPDRIEALDQQWRAETEADDQPLIAATLSSPASAYLTQRQADSRGMFAALFVMDEYGLNVGQSAVTSDYWQGDEAKFENTFPAGADAVFIDEPEYDDGFGMWLVQVNLTLSDGGRPVGAATVELNLDELARRASATR
ncbi:hypothetical protein [Caenispirillum salinarum]|uniref:hypothetical protein n=1 Tax=Caenispirillum salinarum TaxID=859058 RepID=UPI00384CCDBD